MTPWLKTVLCILLSFMCLFTCVGYASLSESLNILGAAQFVPDLPDVYITSVSPLEGAGIEIVNTTGTILMANVSGRGTTTFTVNVKNISDKIYVYERTVDGVQAGIEGAYNGTAITYELGDIATLDEIAPNGGTLSFRVTISVPSGVSTDSYILYFKFIEKKGTEILPDGGEHLDVTFRYNNGQADKVVQVHANDFLERPEVPTRVGYTFIGWYIDATCTTAWNFEADRVTNDMTLYAGWKRNVVREHTVLFKPTDNAQDDFVMTVLDGALLSSPASPVREGYVFTGWYTNEGRTSLWDFSTGTVVADMTLYGGWELYIPPEPPEYSVVFKPNNGEPDREIIVDTAVDSKIPEPTIPVKQGYAFVGWFVDERLTTPWDFATDVVVDHMTLFGAWEEVVYTITFRPNNGTNDSTTSVKQGMLIPRPQVPTKDGYTFIGWYTDEACTLAWNFDTDKPASDMILYGAWEKTQSTDSEGGLHSDFLGLVEALINGREDADMPNALNQSNVIYNRLQSLKHPTHAPILHCSISCIPKGTMSDLAASANKNLTEEYQFVFMADPENKDRIFLYMYYADDCDEAVEGEEIETYFQVISRDSNGKWYADGTYKGTAKVGKYYGGHNNTKPGQYVWTIDVYSWKASSRVAQ